MHYCIYLKKYTSLQNIEVGGSWIVFLVFYLWVTIYSPDGRVALELYLHRSIDNVVFIEAGDKQRLKSLL